MSDTRKLGMYPDLQKWARVQNPHIAKLNTDLQQNSRSKYNKQICLHDKGALLILFNKRKWQALEAIQMTPFDIVGSIHWLIIPGIPLPFSNRVYGIFYHQNRNMKKNITTMTIASWDGLAVFAWFYEKLSVREGLLIIFLSSRRRNISNYYFYCNSLDPCFRAPLVMEPL